MYESILLLANNISSPLIIYNMYGQIIFANTIAAQISTKQLVGENIKNIFLLDNIDIIFNEKNILDLLWQGNKYNTIITKWQKDDIYYYQCLLKKNITSKKNGHIDLEQKYKMLSRHLLSVQDLDRANLARELHGDLGQLLIALKISVFNASIQKDPKVTQQILSENIPLFDIAINSLRDITKGLHPRFIREIGIKQSLNNLINQIANLTDAKIELDISPEIKIENQDIEYSCYRICQEALNNAIKYSSAKKIYINLEDKNNYLKLIISDNGKGFDINQKNDSLGLLSMQERAEQTGGEIKVTSKIGLGTRIQIIWHNTYEQ